MQSWVVHIWEWEENKGGLRGIVYGHPDVEDGHRALTNYLVGKRNGLVVTKSGTHYQLMGDAAKRDALLAKLHELPE